MEFFILTKQKVFLFGSRSVSMPPLKFIRKFEQFCDGVYPIVHWQYTLLSTRNTPQLKGIILWNITEKVKAAL